MSFLLRGFVLAVLMGHPLMGQHLMGLPLMGQALMGLPLMRHPGKDTWHRSPLIMTAHGFSCIAGGSFYPGVIYTSL